MDRCLRDRHQDDAVQKIDVGGDESNKNVTKNRVSTANARLLCSANERNIQVKSLEGLKYVQDDEIGDGGRMIPGVYSLTAIQCHERQRVPGIYRKVGEEAGVGASYD